MSAPPPPTIGYASPIDEALAAPRPLPPWAIFVGYVWIVSEALPLLWKLHQSYRLAGGWYVIGRKLEMTVPAFYSICNDLLLLALIALAAVLPFRAWARGPLLALLCLAITQWAMLLTGEQLAPNRHFKTLMTVQFCVVPLALYSLCGSKTSQRYRRTYWLTLGAIVVWALVLAAEPAWWKLLLGNANVRSNPTTSSSENKPIEFLGLFVWAVLLAVTSTVVLLGVVALVPRRLSAVLTALGVSICSAIALIGWRSLEALGRSRGWSPTIDSFTTWMVVPALQALSLMNWPMLLAMLHRRGFSAAKPTAPRPAASSPAL